MLFSASVAECKGLPVEHWNFDEGKVHHPLHDLVDGAAFYIGATVNPRRRFLGGQSRGGSMPGHCLSWDRLTVLHLANGIGARRVETNLISYCKGRYGHLCTNTAMDSRGVSAQEPAFVYVCTGQRQTPRPPRLRATPERGGGRRLRRSWRPGARRREVRRWPCARRHSGEARAEERCPRCARRRRGPRAAARSHRGPRDLMPHSAMAASRQCQPRQLRPGEPPEARPSRWLPSCAPRPSGGG